MNLIKHHYLNNEITTWPMTLSQTSRLDQWSISIAVAERVASSNKHLHWPMKHQHFGLRKSGKPYGKQQRGGGKDIRHCQARRKKLGRRKKRRRAVRGLLCLAWCIALSVGHRTEPTLIRYRPMNKNNLSRRTIPINKTKYLPRGFHTSDRWSVWSVWYIPT